MSEDEMKKEETPMPSAEISERQAAEQLLDMVPDEKRKDAEQVLGIMVSESFSGPIPPPKVMSDYEKILP